MKNPSQVNGSKRIFLKFSTLLPVILAIKGAPFNDVPSIFLDDDIVIINGWVMLKSDFIEG